MSKYFQQVLVFLLIAFSASSASAQGLECRYLEPIMKGFLKHHVSQQRVSSVVEQRTIDQYIKRLDGSKLYLTNGDVKWIRSKMKGIINQKIRRFDCSPLFEVQKTYMKRVEERLAFAKKWVAKAPKVNKKLEIILDPDSREYPKSAKEANEFQKDYMQFQLANFIASDMKPKEALGNLERRYQRNLKRIKEMKRDDILSNFLDAFAHSLDPHSSYFSKDVLEDFRISMDLSLEGIGATLSSQDGYTVIEQLIPGGAAEASDKLDVKDKIIAVGQVKGKMVPVYDMSLRDVVKLIRGASGTKVRLKILRKETKGNSKFEVSLVRRKINLEEEAAQITYIKKKVGGKEQLVGLLNLPSFYSASKKGGRSAASDMKRILKEAKKKNVDAIVLDFSTNGGGSLDDAVKIAGLFFKKGNVVETNRSKLADVDSTVDYDGPLVVLTSRLSASASEIVAGALKDYKRAVIVGGDHTFGKGSVQSVIPLGQFLGAIKVTVGMFYIPGGQSTQHRGVEADISLPGAFSTEDIGEKTLDYSLPPTKITPFLSKSAYVKSGKGSWSMINDSNLRELRKNSQARVAKNKKFQEVLKDLKENAKKNKNKTIKIAEIIDGPSDEDKKSKKDKKKKKRKGRLSKAEKHKEYMERADINEAIQIAAELADMQVGTQVAGAKRGPSKAKN